MHPDRSAILHYPALNDDGVGELWQGGAPLEDPELPKYFDLVVNASRLDVLKPQAEDGHHYSIRARIYGKVRVIDVDLWDGPMQPGDADAITTVALQVADSVRSGMRVLVHCAQGWNRSGVIVGRALIELGFTPDEAIDIIRKRRDSMALSNPHFAAWLQRQGGKSLAADLAAQEAQALDPSEDWSR